MKEYDPNKKENILIIFVDVIADMISNAKFNPIVTKLFLKEKI